MSPSNEFMQKVVHLSEDKKMHFNFKTKTLSRLAQAKAVTCMRAVSAHACLPISVGVYTTSYTGLMVPKGT